jgi:hypothetical protein
MRTSEGLLVHISADGHICHKMSSCGFWTRRRAVCMSAHILGSKLTGSGSAAIVEQDWCSSLMRTAGGKRLVGGDLRQGLGHFFRVIVGQAGRELGMTSNTCMPVLSDSLEVQLS